MRNPSRVLEIIELVDRITLNYIIPGVAHVIWSW